MKKKIMLVDDNPDFIYMVKRSLERFGDEYEVTSANGGKECFEFLKKGNVPDIILLDIMMPGTDGWTLFAKLKERPEWREIPIVFLTAKTDEYSKGFGKITANDYIEKPFEIMDLKERIDKVLSR
ncbi:MAG: response regulator [Thermoplasmatales archaeon]|nr:MAG: response regulator [Thermoplasmatales archaeon]